MVITNPRICFHYNWIIERETHLKWWPVYTRSGFRDCNTFIFHTTICISPCHNTVCGKTLVNVHLHELTDELKNVPWDFLRTSLRPQVTQSTASLRSWSCQDFILPLWITAGAAKVIEEVRYWLSNSTWVLTELLSAVKTSEYTENVNRHVQQQ